MGENGRIVTPREMEEYQYHASLPPTLKSLSIHLCPPVPYYRLGKIIFDYEYPSQTRASRALRRLIFAGISDSRCVNIIEKSSTTVYRK